MTDINRTIIVPAADVEGARNSVALLDGCTGMFVVGLTTDPSGALPETHFFNTGWMPEEVVPLMWSSAIVRDLGEETFNQTISGLGLHRIVAGD
jgi:hypothetical protein